MPRPLRIDYPGAIHHVMSRGDRHDNIYLDDVDRQEFLKTLAEACLKTDWRVHAYCLMPNHFHLVVETPEANLVAGMHWLLSTYTIRLNRRHDTPGHVFSEKDTAASREEFERRMEARRREEEDEEKLAPLRQGWCLGSQGFRKEMLKLVEQDVRENHDVALRRESAAAKAKRILAEELARRRWTPLDLENRRKSDAGKLAIAARLKKETNLPIKSIAVLVHLGSSKSANANLHRWTQAASKQERKTGSRTQRKEQGDRKINHTNG